MFSFQNKHMKNDKDLVQFLLQHAEEILNILILLFHNKCPIHIWAYQGSKSKWDAPSYPNTYLRGTMLKCLFRRFQVHSPDPIPKNWNPQGPSFKSLKPLMEYLWIPDNPKYNQILLKPWQISKEKPSH